MTTKCFLFVYGMLKPNISPPRSTSDHWSDAIQGELYDIGDYPAAINTHKNSNIIEGFLVEIDQDELLILDDYEDVDSGEFRRILVDTKLGHAAWVYEYCLALPKDAKLISNWEAKASSPRYS